MTTVPVPVVVASPEVFNVATVVSLDDHDTVLVRFCVVLSLNVPVAVNCCVVPKATEESAGVIAMERSTAAVTVRVVDPDTLPEVAATVVVPIPTLVARPCDPAVLLTLATLGLLETHCTVVVMFWVEPSVNVPVAVNC